MTAGAFKLLIRLYRFVLVKMHAAERDRATVAIPGAGWNGISNLEPRILYSASPLMEMIPGAGDASTAHAIELDEAAASITAEAERDPAFDTFEFDVADAADDARLELVIVDASTPDYEQLVQDLMNADDGTRRIDVVILDGGRDGIEQISEILGRYDGLDAIHIVSHGTDGGVQLGGGWLTAETLVDDGDAIGAWSDALAGEADLLFYGCDLAASAEGRALTESLAALTGADVAASIDLTGSAALGGDWELEHATGEIETSVAFSETARASWSGVLTVTTANDDSASTLQNTPVVIDVVGNDTDPESDPIVVLDHTLPTNGSVVDNGDGTLTYTPGSGFTGADAFDYLVSDGTDGTVHYWNLDGQADDAVGSSDGAVTGTTSVPGHYGDAMSFDGGDDHVVIPDVAYAGEFTVSFRFKVDDISGSSFQYIYSHGVSDQPNSLNVYVGEASSAYPGMMLTNLRDANDPVDGTELNVDISGLVGDGEWHTYTLTVDAANGSTVYIDGVPGNSSTRGKDAFDPGTDLYLGGRNDLDSTRFYGGALDSVQIHDRSLSAPEVDDLHTGGSARATVNITVDPATPLLWTTTFDDASSTGAPGLDDWTGGEILEFGGPNLTFDSAGTPADTTDGTFSRVFNLDDLVVGNDATVTDFHYVNTHITVGSGVDSFDLEPGDVIFSTYNAETLQSTNTLPVDYIDVSVFRPDVAGNYSAGTFTMLIDGSQIPERSGGLHGISLVESDTMVGDSLVTAGTFLLADSTSNAVIHYTADTVGEGTTSGTWSTLIDGDDIGMQQFVRGIELIETETEIGGTTLAAGTILLTVNVDDNGVGDNTVNVDKEDIFYLTVGKTEWDQATTVADATLFLDGSEVGLNTDAERINGFSLVYTAASTANSAPVITASQTFNVSEAAGNGDPVGTVAAADPDVADTLQDWTIVSGNDDGIFQIDGSSGAITIVDSTNLDRETTSSYVLTLQVGDGVNTSATETVTIGIDDVNDNAPVITASQSFNVAENAADTTVVGTVAVTDADVSTTYGNWTITAGNTGGVFEIDASSGQIRVADNTSLDRETTGSYTLSIQVDDGANTSETRTVTVNVTDVNDNAPVITPSQSFNVAENAADTTVVGTVAVTDADVSTTYGNWTITAGNTGSVFEIDASSGQIRVADNTSLDRETTGSYTLTVQVDDGVNTSATQTVTVTVTDVNDTAPVITASQAFNVSEEASVGDSVGTVAATDADTTGSLADWTIVSGNDDAIFQIDATSGEIRVADTTNLDADTTNSYVLTLQVGDGVQTSASETVAITILNANDNAPSLADATFSLDENSPNGTVVGTIAGSDDDPGDTLGYTIIGGTGQTAFAIGGASGQITVADSAQLDLETTASFTLVVKATDDGTPGRSDTATITIDLNDLNDVAPVVTAGQAFSVSEFASTGDSVGTVAAVDADTVGGLSGWQIVSGNDDGIFGIDAASGEITIADATNLDHETTDSHVLAVRLVDGVNTSATETVTITVDDENDAPTTTGLADVSTTEDAASTVVDLHAAFDDAETADGDLTFTIVSNTNAGLFKTTMIDPAAGTLTLELAKDQNGSAVITVRAADTGGAGEETAFTVSVDPVNDLPVVTTNTGATVLAQTTTTVTGAMLGATDVDDAAAQVIFTVTAAPGNGTLALAGGALTTGDTFTQADLDAGRITFTAGTESDGFAFTLTDSTGVAGATQTFDVAVTIAVPILPDTPAPTPEPALAPTPTPDPIPEETTAEAEEPDVEAETTAENGDEPGSGDVIYHLDEAGAEAAAIAATGNTADALEMSADGTGTISTVRDRVTSVGDEESWAEALAAQIAETAGEAFDLGSDIARSGIQLIANTNPLWDELDQLNQSFESDRVAQEYLAGSATFVVVGTSVGYFMLMVRGGQLVASLLSSMPAWSLVDPLPILDHLGGDLVGSADTGPGEDGETLLSMIENAKQ